jgi:hypothetical protein
MANLYPNNVIELAKALPPIQSLLIRGPHGIGKSQIAAEVGRVLDMRVIDLRLSQMTEGDFLGLPKIVEPILDHDGNVVKHGMTEFRPPWWFIAAMEGPVVLFLDEINRAVPEVMQCAFQLVLDRAIQGKSVHPGTIVIAAINASHHYQVNEMDPALLDRFLVVDMVPNIDVWKKWARGPGKIDSAIVEFCGQHPDHWWHNPEGSSGLQPGKVYPTPRAWDMLNRCLEHAGLLQDPTKAMFRYMAQGLVGNEAGAAFYDFVKNYDRNITAEQLLNHYETIESRVKSGLTIEQVMTLAEKLVHHGNTHRWKAAQAQNLANFMRDIGSGELVAALWTKINGSTSRGKDPNATIAKHAQANAMLVHKHCGQLIRAAYVQGDDAR